MSKTIRFLLVAALVPTGWLGATIKEPGDTKAAPVQMAPDKAFGPAETIQGSLMWMVKEQRVIVLKAEGGVPFNFKVTATTKIEIGRKKSGFEDLDKLTDAKISVTYVPTERGNVATKIQIGQ
jgi:hypothetical protein